MAEDPNVGDPAGSGDPSGGGDPAGGGGGDPQPQPTFLESLPEDLRGHSMLKGMEKAEGADVVKSLVEMLDKVPKAPENRDGYQFQIPEKYQYFNTEELEAFKDFALENNLSTDLAQKMVNFDLARMERTLNSIDTEQQQAAQELRKTWGKDYDDNLKKAQSVIKAFAPIAGKINGKPVTELLTQDGFFGFGNVPQVVALFHAISTAISEDWLSRGADNQPPGARAEKSMAEVLYPKQK